jgi:Tfp pilus assembly pilus retraction ATPase PilT
MVEFFPGVKQPMIRLLLAGVLSGVISQRLLPKQGGGRVAAVEVMVNNARIAELIRENKAEEITDAIGDGAFFQMQTVTQALLDHVLSGRVDPEVAANAASNRHDFMVALEYAEKAHSVGLDHNASTAALVAEAPAEEEPEPELTLRLAPLGD